MNKLTMIGIAGVGLIILTKGEIFTTLKAALGLGSKAAEYGTKAIEGVGMILEVGEESIEVAAVWLGEQYYFDESTNSAIIEHFENEGLTGQTFRDTIEYIEAGNLQIFKDIITRETCSKFFMDIVQETAGDSRWWQFNVWANIQIAVILAP